MKIINQGNQLTLKTSGIGQIFFGVLFIVIGVAVMVFSGSFTDSETGEKTSSMIPLIFGAVFLIAGLAIAFFAKNMTVVLDKSSQSSISTKRIIGGQAKSQNFNSSDIAAVQLITGMDYSSSSTGDSNNRPQRRSTLSLLLKNNDLIEIANKSGSSGFLGGMNSLIGKAPLGNEASEIANFLGVPVQSQDISGMTGAIGTIFGNNNQPIVSETGQATPAQPTAQPQNQQPSAQPTTPQPSAPQPANPQVAPEQPPTSPTTNPSSENQQPKTY